MPPLPFSPSFGGSEYQYLIPFEGTGRHRFMPTLPPFGPSFGGSEYQYHIPFEGTGRHRFMPTLPPFGPSFGGSDNEHHENEEASEVNDSDRRPMVRPGEMVRLDTRDTHRNELEDLFRGLLFPVSDSVDALPAVGYTDHDVDVLKKTIWREACGEPHEGQVAVAHVIKNRALANRRGFGGDSITGVCLQPMQFSCWNNKKPEEVQYKGKKWDDMDEWVRGVLDGTVPDPTDGSLHYINPAKCDPSWAKKMKVGVKIANHQFFHEK